MPDTFFDTLEDAIKRGDSVFTADLTALNNTGSSGTATLVRDGDMLTVAIAAHGLTPGDVHIGHIHGTFDDMGNPTDAMSPTIAVDADKDGFVELAEGATVYGPILVPFVDENGDSPVADDAGNLFFQRTFDLGDSDTFADGFNADDLGDLSLREIVLHGADVPDGEGAGTTGEVDGGTNGFTLVLPASSGEIEQATEQSALNSLDTQRDEFGMRVVGTAQDDDLSGGSANDFLGGLAGDDSLLGRGGDDRVYAGGGDDTVRGGMGNDFLFGSGDNDRLYGNSGSDTLGGGSGDDWLFGQSGNDELYAGGGNDSLNGGDGNDLMRGGAGNDFFIYYNGDGQDSIADYNPDEDTIQLRGIDSTDVQLTSLYGGTQVSFVNDEGSIFVAGVAADDVFLIYG